jgi:DNA modification methylase
MKIKLSENQKRDILKLIETGKPLPGKYRFLIFEEQKEVELLWNGKSNEIENVVLPFQSIEVIDEPRAENSSETNLQNNLFDFDDRGRQMKGWTNKLIWGDNKLILSSLKNGAMREEIEKQGGLKLIYIDPPFDVGADFSMKVEIGDDEFVKKPNVLEELAYRDTWGRGADSFIAMIYERLSLMRDLLADDGSIYVHCDYRVSAYIKLILDEIFGVDKLKNEIIWCYTGNAAPGQKQFSRKHDSIFWYSKSENVIFNDLDVRVPYSEKTLANFKKGLEGSSYDGKSAYKEGQDKIGKLPEDWWEMAIAQRYPVDGIKRTGYPTEKPFPLIERIIQASSNEGDLVADFFAGSGTTLAVAEKLGRKWIGSDLGKFAIHTTRKRMIGVQRDLKNSRKDFRAFEILNLGKYERQHFLGVNLNFREEEKQKQLQKKEKEFLELIVRAYKAEAVQNFKTFHAKKAGRMVAIGPMDFPVSRLFVEEIISECVEKQFTKVDILSFEYEMGLFPKIQEDAKAEGIDLALKHIPREVFDKRAIEKNQIQFHDVSFIEIKPHIEKTLVAVELTDFSVYYNQDIIDNIIASLKNGSNKVLVENGNIVKISKDKDGIISREILTKKWTDWIDYWAVDFDFESKQEIIRIKNEETGDWEEKWTGDYIFENEWQSFRTKKDRSIELKSVFHECGKGKRKIAVKVVDIFGNDTMKVVEIIV